jgi:hypothetical protein
VHSVDKFGGMVKSSHGKIVKNKLGGSFAQNWVGDWEIGPGKTMRGAYHSLRSCGEWLYLELCLVKNSFFLNDQLTKF